MLFVLRDDDIPIRAKEFAYREVTRAEQFLVAGRAALEAVENDMDNQPEMAGGPWDDGGGRKHERISQEVRQAEKRLKAAHIKYNWEYNNVWSKSIKVHPLAMPTPWKDDADNWVKCFKRRF
jgi:hypothetical protein